MNTKMSPSTGRSVQLAVMAAPTTSILQAVAHSRRPHAAPVRASVGPARFRVIVPAAA
jgi:hypothetical protein